MTGRNIVRTKAIHRRCLTRLAAAGAIGAALFLGGCAGDGASERDWHPFAKNASVGRDEPAAKQARADSFPTAQEAGL